MMKKILLFVLVLSAFLLVVSAQQYSFSENSLTTCENGICETEVYQIPKFWFDTSYGKWKEIDESFMPSKHCSGYDACVLDNLYQAHIDDTSKEIRIVHDGQEVIVRPDRLVYEKGGSVLEVLGTYDTSTQTTRENVRTYEDAFGISNTHMSFTYIGDRLKTELLIEDVLELPAAPESVDFDNSGLKKPKKPGKDKKPHKLDLGIDDVSIKERFDLFEEDSEEIEKETEVESESTEILDAETYLVLVSYIEVDEDFEFVINDDVWNGKEAYTTEEVIIKDPSGNEVFFIPSASAHDSLFGKADAERRFRVMPGAEKEVIGQNIFVEHSVLVPMSWVYSTSPDDENPIVIDVSMSIVSEDVNWNGLIVKKSVLNGTAYDRISNPFQYFALGGSANASDARAVLEWDVSDLPSDANIIDAELVIYVKDLVMNPIMALWDLLSPHELYPDTPGDCDGNCDLYNEAGQGTLYATEMPGKQGGVVIDLHNAFISDLDSALSSSSALGVGISVDESVKVSSKLFSADKARPYLRLTYNFTYANETEGDEATKIGIEKAIVQPKIMEEQKVILALPGQSQELLTYDKFTSSGLQRWGFNYITSGESFGEEKNVNDKFLTSEYTNLSYHQIIDHVEGFILDSVE